jgi:hypothetical protein
MGVLSSYMFTLRKDQLSDEFPWKQKRKRQGKAWRLGESERDGSQVACAAC